MYWRQKGQITCTTSARANQVLATVTNYLADKNTRDKRVYRAAPTDTPNSVIIQVEYVNKVDADQVWADIMNVNDQAWIIDPSFIGYAQMPENETESFALLDRRDW